MKQSISYNLNNIVKKTGLKKYAVAEKCGYSAKRFSDILCGRKRITDADIIKLCEGLDISPNDLFGYNETA